MIYSLHIAPFCDVHSGVHEGIFGGGIRRLRLVLKDLCLTLANVF